ncbi:hypothetical protein LOD99_4563 [Oopsacas minuta]|uniref:Uncharacterized protein n=1 Tax=Oopsacas minuta TaxID=111878 RepID=A0AAV7JST1_9METZ|nr:hypothetical protein LOD99_4563 [Oopsacas minuta]
MRPATDANCRILSTQNTSLKPKNKAEEDKLIAEAIAASLKESQRQGARANPPKPTLPSSSSVPKTAKERKEQEDIDFAIALSLSEADRAKKQKAISVK